MIKPSELNPATHPLTHRQAAHYLCYTPNLRNLLVCATSREGWICNEPKWRKVERPVMFRSSLTFKAMIYVLLLIMHGPFDTWRWGWSCSCCCESRRQLLEESCRERRALHHGLLQGSRLVWTLGEVWCERHDLVKSAERKLMDD